MEDNTDNSIVPLIQADASGPGQYALVREAGRGGMSVVHEARHTMTGQTVAIKVLVVPPGLPPEQTQAMHAQFEREARAMAGLSHPNIVHTHELTKQGGQTFLVMEYLRGETLRARLARGPLTPAQALPVLRQVASAVDAVHGQGLVHRDIKPSNVMLLPDGTAKLLDFGVVRHRRDIAAPATDVLVGSPAHMAPEQVRGGVGTAASDVWALGVLLYEMLAGRLPFTGTSIPSVVYQIYHEEPPAITGLTAPVQRVLRRSLDKNPARRYPNARALGRDLAWAVSPVGSLVPFRRAAAVALAVTALLGLSVAFLHRHTPRQSAAVPQTPAPVAGQGVAAKSAPVSPVTPRAVAARPAAHFPPAPRPHRRDVSTAKALPPVPAKARTTRPRLMVKRSVAVPRIRVAALPRLAPPVRHTPPRRRLAPPRGAGKVAAAPPRPARATPRRATVIQRLADSRQVRKAKPAPRRRKSRDFDRYASLRLQRFIWGEGR